MVNAWVDEGIAPLVVALNGISGVATLDSCQEGALGESFVFFTYGHTWHELATLLQETSYALSEAHLPCGYALRIEWLGSNSVPRAQVSVRPEHVAALSDGINGVVSDLNRRMTELVGDRQRRVPHSLLRCRGQYDDAAKKVGLVR